MTSEDSTVILAHYFKRGTYRGSYQNFEIHGGFLVCGPGSRRPVRRLLRGAYEF
jgi:hypothetical protein